MEVHTETGMCTFKVYFSLWYKFNTCLRVRTSGFWRGFGVPLCHFCYVGKSECLHSSRAKLSSGWEIQKAERRFRCPNPRVTSSLHFQSYRHICKWRFFVHMKWCTSWVTPAMLWKSNLLLCLPSLAWLLPGFSQGLSGGISSMWSWQWQPQHSREKRVGKEWLGTPLQFPQQSRGWDPLMVMWCSLFPTGLLSICCRCAVLEKAAKVYSWCIENFYSSFKSVLLR